MRGAQHAKDDSPACPVSPGEMDHVFHYSGRRVGRAARLCVPVAPRLVACYARRPSRGMNPVCIESQTSQSGTNLLPVRGSSPVPAAPTRVLSFLARAPTRHAGSTLSARLDNISIRCTFRVRHRAARIRAPTRRDRLNRSGRGFGRVQRARDRDWHSELIVFFMVFCFEIVDDDFKIDG